MESIAMPAVGYGMCFVALLQSRAAAWMDAYLLAVKRGDALSANLSPVDGMRVGHVGHREYGQALCKHAIIESKTFPRLETQHRVEACSTISGTVMLSIVLKLA